MSQEKGDGREDVDGDDDGDGDDGDGGDGDGDDAHAGHRCLSQKSFSNPSLCIPPLCAQLPLPPSVRWNWILAQLLFHHREERSLWLSTDRAAQAH